MGDTTKNVLLYLFKLYIDAKSSQRSKKEIRNLEETNILNRNVYNIPPGPIENFIGYEEQLANMAFSGASESIRVGGIVRSVDYALSQGHSIVILHCSNNFLSEYLAYYYDEEFVTLISPSNPVFDPFIGLRNSEIYKIILNSTASGFEIRPEGRYYIDGICNLIRSYRQDLSCERFINCPHDLILSKVNEARSNLIIDEQKAQLITSSILRGEAEKGNVEHFFNGLASQSKRILARKNNFEFATNINHSVQNNRIVIIDVMSNTNNLLINLLVNEIINLIETTGKKLLVVLDNIQLSASEKLLGLVNNCGAFKLLLSSDDVFASFSGEENPFNSFIGKCSSIMIGNHASAISAAKWSDVFGYYEKQEISKTYSQTATLWSGLSSGSSKSISINPKRENIVKPEQIMRMKPNEVFIKNRSISEVLHTEIT